MLEVLDKFETCQGGASGKRGTYVKQVGIKLHMSNIRGAQGGT